MADRNGNPDAPERARSRPPAGVIARALPLLAAAALLIFGLAWRSHSRDLVAAAAAGFGLLAGAGLLHLLALRFPRRYTLDGFAWVITMIAVLFALIFGLVGEH